MQNSKVLPEARPDMRAEAEKYADAAIEGIAASLEDHGSLPPGEELLRQAFIAQTFETVFKEKATAKVLEARGLPEGKRPTWGRVADVMDAVGPQQAHNRYAPGKEYRNAESKVRAKRTRHPAEPIVLPGLSAEDVVKALVINRNTVAAWGKTKGKLHTHALRDEEGNIVTKPKNDPNGKPVLRYYLDGMTRRQAASHLGLPESEVDMLVSFGKLPTSPALGKGGRPLLDENGQPYSWYWPEHME